MLTFRNASNSDINLLGSLAREIWMSYYPNILSTEQIEYMLGLMYSAKTIEQELGRGVIWVVVEADSEPIGFIAFTTCQNTEVKLNKLYLKIEQQGKGYGKASLNYVIEYAKEHQCNKVYLTVNKNNTKAIKAYEKTGFIRTESIVSDIGAGFVMDDYVYSYKIN
jgi:RimJ/RimL family protein N-acetyltransferase